MMILSYGYQNKDNKKQIQLLTCNKHIFLFVTCTNYIIFIASIDSGTGAPHRQSYIWNTKLFKIT